jgi:hypothetical protein
MPQDGRTEHPYSYVQHNMSSLKVEKWNIFTISLSEQMTHTSNQTECNASSTSMHSFFPQEDYNLESMNNRVAP